MSTTWAWFDLCGDNGHRVYDDRKLFLIHFLRYCEETITLEGVRQFPLSRLYTQTRTKGEEERKEMRDAHMNISHPQNLPH